MFKRSPKELESFIQPMEQMSTGRIFFCLTKEKNRLNGVFFFKLSEFLVLKM